MASVLAIFIARKLVGRTALKCYALALSFWGIGRLVWVGKVFENFLVASNTGLEGVSHFLLSALEHAHLGVQLSLVVVVLAGISLVLDLARAAAPCARFAA